MKEKIVSNTKIAPNLTGTPAGYWTSREAYLLALVCLTSGLLIGYVFHGSQSPVAALPNMTQTASAAPGAANPQQPMPTVKDLEPLASPLLMKLRANPKDVETLTQLGNLYYDHHLYAESTKYYEQSLELAPNNPNVRTDLGTAYWYSGFPERAVAEYEKSLAVDAKHANTLYNMGIVRLEGLNDSQGALRAFEKLLAANPSPEQRARALELMERARQKKAS